MSTPDRPDDATTSYPVPAQPTVSLDKPMSVGDDATAVHATAEVARTAENAKPISLEKSAPAGDAVTSAYGIPENPTTQHAYSDPAAATAAYGVGPSSTLDYSDPAQSAPFQETQYQQVPFQQAPYGGYPAGPPAGYPGYPQQPSQGGGGRSVLIGIGIACVIALAAAAVFVWLKVAEADSDSSTTAQSGATVTETAQQTAPTAETVAVDPEVAAGESMRTQAASDASSVRVSNNNQWAAQVSSKRLGLVAEGRTWDNQAIWSEFEASRSRYPQVKLLNSGDWPVFSEPGWWITISAQNFPSAESALAWCRSVGLDKDHCFAKLVSDSRGPEGTTLYQR